MKSKKSTENIDGISNAFNLMIKGEEFGTKVRVP